MRMDKKKLAAAMAAVTAYVNTGEAASLNTAPLNMHPGGAQAGFAPPPPG